ncbi:hypothetical protein GCM10025869_24270 [Homoserinibacter gongjuensis]|uniref:Uncharacterized protein n=1 Tax=Homoserinibacter gongjuensis TaxID=1162968 RepID=A0ABQ6JUP0_9MICO|nr:hypothetical protein GCM10025869_24270 [Homoserinibacter gongjuensis]
MRVAGQAPLPRRPAQHGTVDRGQHARHEPVAQGGHPGQRQLANRARRSDTERRGPRGILRSGPSALLIAAVQQRLDGRRTGEHEGTDADRAADLVRRDRHGIRPHRVHVDRHLPERRDGVEVHGHAVAVRELDDLGHGLQRADLVVGPQGRHEGDLVGVDRERRRERIEADAALAVEFDPIDARVLVAAEPLDGVEGRVVLAEGAMIRGRRACALRAQNMPFTARLIDSVPPLVSTTSTGSAPSAWAIASRPDSSSSRAAWPAPWIEAGLPTSRSASV